MSDVLKGYEFHPPEAARVEPESLEVSNEELTRYYRSIEGNDKTGVVDRIEIHSDILWSVVHIEGQQVQGVKYSRREFMKWREEQSCKQEPNTPEWTKEDVEAAIVNHVRRTGSLKRDIKFIVIKHSDQVSGLQKKLGYDEYQDWVCWNGIVRKSDIEVEDVSGNRTTWTRPEASEGEPSLPQTPETLGVKGDAEDVMGGYPDIDAMGREAYKRAMMGSTISVGRAGSMTDKGVVDVEDVMHHDDGVISFKFEGVPGGLHKAMVEANKPKFTSEELAEGHDLRDKYIKGSWSTPTQPPREVTHSGTFKFLNGDTFEIPPPGDGWEIAGCPVWDCDPVATKFLMINKRRTINLSNTGIYGINHKPGLMMAAEYDVRALHEGLSCTELTRWERDKPKPLLKDYVHGLSAERYPLIHRSLERFEFNSQCKTVASTWPEAHPTRHVKCAV